MPPPAAEEQEASEPRERSRVLTGHPPSRPWEPSTEPGSVAQAPGSPCPPPPAHLSLFSSAFPFLTQSLSGKRGRVSERRFHEPPGQCGGAPLSAEPRPGPQQIPISSTHTGGQSGQLLADLNPRPTRGIGARDCSGQ